MGVLRNYNFKLLIEGIEVASIQSFTRPKISYAKHTHGTPGNQPDTKTAGKKMIEDGKFDYVVSSPGGDNLMWAQFLATQTTSPDFYKRNVTLIELAEDNITPVKTYLLKGFFILEIEENEYKSSSEESADILRGVTYCVDDII